MTVVLIIVGTAVVLGLYLMVTYNGFILLRTRIEEALSGIDVQLKRRADLIPNLVETVKGYAKHEKGVFEEVTKARSALMNASGTKEKAQADDMLTGALKSLFAVAEAYPDLKANTNFQQLQQELTDTEDKVAYSRQFYNKNVMDYNAKIEMFPSNIVASLFSFTKYDYFETEEKDRKKIEVKF